MFFPWQHQTTILGWWSQQTPRYFAQGAYKEYPDHAMLNAGALYTRLESKQLGVTFIDATLITKWNIVQPLRIKQWVEKECWMPSWASCSPHSTWGIIANSLLEACIKRPSLNYIQLCQPKISTPQPVQGYYLRSEFIQIITFKWYYVAIPCNTIINLNSRHKSPHMTLITGHSTSPWGNVGRQAV